MEEFTGTIKLFAGDFAPRDWAFCHGQLLPISGNDDLFALIMNTYGGDGASNFALPDLRSRVPMGAGQGTGLKAYGAGNTGGVEKQKITIAHLPEHTHAAHLNVSSADSTMGTPVADAVLARPGSLAGRVFSESFGYNTSTPDILLNATSITTDKVGTGADLEMMQPYIAMNYIICLKGIFPSRP